jgi:hypothetical protein
MIVAKCLIVAAICFNALLLAFDRFTITEFNDTMYHKRMIAFWQQVYIQHVPIDTMDM